MTLGLISYRMHGFPRPRGEIFRRVDGHIEITDVGRDAALPSLMAGYRQQRHGLLFRYRRTLKIVTFGHVSNPIVVIVIHLGRHRHRKTDPLYIAQRFQLGGLRARHHRGLNTLKKKEKFLREMVHQVLRR